MTLDVLFWTFTGFAFALGAVVGSFLNVVIHRVPAEMSIISPPSHCPVCEHQIRWYDNIPIISWALILRGKCRNCATSIPARYAIVEGLTAALTAALWVKVAGGAFESTAVFESTPPIDYVLPFVLYLVFVCLLIVISFVDLEHLIIPHRFTLLGMALGLATPWIFSWTLEPGALGGFWPPVTPMESLIGFVAGGLTVVIIFYAYFAIRGVAGIGGGDVTLMALVGAWLGWPALVFIFFAASVQGTLAAAVAMLAGGGLLRDSAEIFAEDELAEEAKARLEDDAVAQIAQPDQASEVPGEDVIEADENADSSEEEAAAAEDADGEAQGGLAVPFGPFIALAALEHFFVGDLLPAAISMSYLYTFGSW
jgi:leader peptidase (prepilin peptidase) / N-methyltransferase